MKSVHEKIAEKSCRLQLFSQLKAPIKAAPLGSKPKSVSKSKAVWTRIDFIKLLFLVLATFDHKLGVSYALGSFVRSEGNAVQPIARGLLQIYATHTATFFIVQASFIAIENKRRSDAKKDIHLNPLSFSWRNRLMGHSFD